MAIEDPAGTIAVLFSSEAARYSGFMRDLDHVKAPPGTVKDFGIGPDRALLMDDIVERALAAGSYWVWFVDEDLAFDTDVLEKLLAAPDGIVAPIVLNREEPYYPDVFVGRHRTGELIPLALNDIAGPDTAIEIIAAGTSGLLVRRAVFEEVGASWFAEGTEDLFTRALDAGFTAMAITSARIGTRLTATMRPAFVGGRWHVAIDELGSSAPLRH